MSGFADSPGFIFFFSQQVSGLVKEYDTLFGLADKESEEPGDEEDVDEPVGFFEKWTWVYNTDIVANLVHQSWDEVLQKSVIEFLNLMSYQRDKDAWEKAEREKWKAKH